VLAKPVASTFVVYDLILRVSFIRRRRSHCLKYLALQHLIDTVAS
jgi:hypothetical protein